MMSIKVIAIIYGNSYLFVQFSLGDYLAKIHDEKSQYLSK